MSVVSATCPECRCLIIAHHGDLGCEGLGGNCPCQLTPEEAARGALTEGGPTKGGE